MARNRSVQDLTVDELRQRAKELALMSELGLPLAQSLSTPSSTPTEQEDEALDETPAGDA